MILSIGVVWANRVNLDILLGWVNWDILVCFVNWTG